MADRWQGIPYFPSWRQLVAEYANRRVLSLFGLGFSSGLPLMLTSSTLHARMSSEGVDVRLIGLSSLIGLPYTLKILWAPVMDRFALPMLGRRRGWIAVCQCMLALSIGALGTVSPGQTVEAVACCAFVVALLSASQDIVVDAYRADVVRISELGPGAAASVVGYRIAMVIASAGALILSDFVPWHIVYGLMAAIMFLGISVTLAAPEPEQQSRPPQTLRDAVVLPLRVFFQRRGAPAALLFIALFKLGDVLAGALMTPFLLELGFSRSEVGAVNKAFGLGATIAGTLIGGGMVARLGMNRSLWIFAILQGLSNLSFAGLALVGKNYGALVAAVGVENICGGMGTAGFVGFLMGLCDKRFTATQYALLSSIAGSARVGIGAVSGFMVAALGWPVFLALSALGALPTLVLLPLVTSGYATASPGREQPLPCEKQALKSPPA